MRLVGFDYHRLRALDSMARYHLRECEDYAMKCHNIEFNSEKEQADVEEIFNNAVQWCLNEGDQNLRAITVSG